MDKNKIRYHLFYGLLWIAIILLGLIACLPKTISFTIGKYLGKLGYLFPSKAKHTTEVNLKLCFPDLNDKERRALAKQNFISLGIALIEAGMACFFSNKKLQALYTLHGFEHVQKALNEGKGVLIVSSHFTSAELIARFVAMQANLGILYRPHKKPALATFQEYFRKRHFKYYIRSNDIKQLLSTLRNNKAICYPYDLDDDGKRNVFAPFFGIPTASLTTVADIARLSGAVVIPMRYFRQDNNKKYEIIFSAPLENFPSGDNIADATRLNAFIEDAIRQKPEQYVWQYKRFKTRPKGQKRFYYSSNFPPRWRGMNNSHT